MSAVRVEAFLARLYVDAEARRRFVADPRGCARQAGLAEADVDSLATLDPIGLELASRSFESKRGRPARTGRPRWRDWLSRLARAR